MSNSGSFYNWGTPVSTSSSYNNNYNINPCFTPVNELSLSIQSPYYYNKTYVDPAKNTFSQTYPMYSNQSIQNSSFASSGYGSEYNNLSYNNSPVNYLRNNFSYNNYSNNVSFLSETASPSVNTYSNSTSSCSNNNESLRNENNKRIRTETSYSSNSIDTELILNEIFQNSEPVPKKQKRSYNKKPKIAKEDQLIKKKDNDKQYDNANIYLQSANYPFNTEFSDVLKPSEYLNYNDIIEENNDNKDEDLFADDNDENNSLSYSINSFGEKKKRVLSKSQRIAANQRERKRMNIMNETFAKLRQVLPISTGRRRRKMSRIDIVVGAMEYIAYLSDLVERDEPCEIKFDIFKNSLFSYD